MASGKILLAALFFLTISMLQAQEYQWLKGIHGGNDEEGLGLTVDNTGQPICCGYFTSNEMNAGGSGLIKKSGENDAYIIKYDLNGNPLWMDNPGGNVSQMARGVSTDSENNIYLAGWFKGGFSFGSNELQSMNDIDGMLLKYDQDGNEIWGIEINSAGQTEGWLIKTDHQDNIIVAGRFYDHDIDFGDTSVVNHGALDIFMAKYTSEGTFLWARSFGGSNEDFILDFCVDDLNNIYFTSGCHSQNVDFGTYSFNNACGLRMAVIVQMDPDGEVTWAEHHDEGYDQQFMAIDVDSDLNIYAGGYFKGDLLFGPELLQNNAGQFDVFLLKYNAQHEVLWAQKIASEIYDRIDHLVLDDSNNIYIELVTFGDMQIGGTTFYNSGMRDFLIPKFDADGNYQWCIHGGGELDERSFSLEMSPLNNLYFTGYFMSGQLTLGQHQISNSGMKDSFIASIGPDCLLADPYFDFVVDSFSVQFTALPGADAYLWDFGDGDTSSAISPIHTYADFGDYNACLTVTNICGQNSNCETIQICVDPKADFVYDKFLPDVYFYQLAQYADDYLWDFGDGIYSTEANPVHTYANPENFIVTLTVFNDCGADQHIDTLFLEPPMMCNFSFTIENGVIYFSDESLDAFSYLWEFGDGNTSSENNPVHQYEHYGTYNCCLTIENEEGVFSFCDSVFYCEEASAEFNYDLQDARLLISDLSSKADSWYWDFGDGSTSLLAEPTHEYEQSGTYTLCMEASNPCSKDSSCKEIYVEIPEEEVVSYSLKFYLVPSGNLLKIDIPQDGSYDLCLYNMLGEPVYEGTFIVNKGNSIELNISTLATGVYICDLKSQNISGRKKIFISP